MCVVTRVNVYLPDELPADAEKAGINLSATTQEAVRRTLAELSTDDLLAEIAATASTVQVSHDQAMDALEAARDEASTRHGGGRQSTLPPWSICCSIRSWVAMSAVGSRSRDARTGPPRCRGPRRWGRLHRGGDLAADEVEIGLRQLQAAPVRRHPVPDLLVGTWLRRHQLRLVDALYVQLAVSRGISLVTTGRLLRTEPTVDIVGT